MGDWLLPVGFVIVVGGLYWLSSRIEAHWVSRDGSRMIVVAHEVRKDDTSPSGSLKELRIDVLPGALSVTRRHLGRRRQYLYRVAGAVQNPPKGKRQYLLSPHDGNPEQPDWVVRMPESSRAVAIFDQRLPPPAVLGSAAVEELPER